MQNFRIGFGYDLHRLVSGRPLMLGGVHIPSDKGLAGHSDADALLHAVCDALLGAAALRDIGFHFPDTDPQWKGAPSKVFAVKTLELVREKAFEIGNIDATIIAEAPKLNPHFPRMLASLALLFDMNPGDVSLKATTNEGLDATGRGEAIAVHAVALIYRKPKETE